MRMLLPLCLFLCFLPHLSPPPPPPPPTHTPHFLSLSPSLSFFLSLSIYLSLCLLLLLSLPLCYQFFYLSIYLSIYINICFLSSSLSLPTYLLSLHFFSSLSFYIFHIPLFVSLILPFSFPIWSFSSQTSS